MGYELGGVETSQAPVQSSQPMVREEKVVSMYDDAPSRYAQAMAKARGEVSAADPKTNSSNISESVSAEAPAKSEASLPLSPQLAALARKEQALRKEQASVKARELALDKERSEISDLKRIKAQIAAGDYSEADKLLDYEKYTQHKLGKDPRTDELEKIRSEVAAVKAAQEKDVEDRFNSAVQQRRVAVKGLIASGDEFKAIKAKGAEEAVVQHILDTWENDEIELSPEQAAKEVEAELLARAESWASLVRKDQPQVSAPQPKELPPLKTGMKTLTNDMASTGEIKRVTKPLHLMSEQERYAEARARFEDKIRNGQR